MGKNPSPQVSDKQTYRIGEVANLAQIEAHVLRYWETEFPVLKPAKSPRGQRLYTAADVETILTIKRLLYQEGFTIAGARKQLEAERTGALAPAEPHTPANPAPSENPTRAQLEAIRNELRALLTLLSSR